MAPISERHDSNRNQDWNGRVRALSYAEIDATSRIPGLELIDSRAGGVVESSGPSDGELVQQALSGREDAFATLVTRYHRKAFWIAFHLLGRVEDARDVVQESFLRLFRSLDSFDFGRNFYTWFYRIVMNLAIDALRKSRSAKATALEDFADLPLNEDDGTPVDRRETGSLVWQVLEKLDGKFRAVLVLRDIHGMSCREIAPILKVTHATVRWRLHRGRQIFREHWGRIAKGWQG